MLSEMAVKGQEDTGGDAPLRLGASPRYGHRIKVCFFYNKEVYGKGEGRRLALSLQRGGEER